MITFWTCALGLTILLYVTLDGFDLGVGMLFAFAPNEAARRHMLASISPVWDGNETWLVIAAAILFGAFPLVYATLLSALYLPLLVMLVALILRGVAFEFRYKSRGLRRLWDIGFAGGSFVASFVQGLPSARWSRGSPSRTAAMSAVRSAGCRPSPCCAGWGCASATACSAPAG